MAKFLNETGLSYFWTKVKAFLSKTYVAIGSTINIDYKVGTSDEAHTTLNGSNITITDTTDVRHIDINNRTISVENDTSGTIISSNSINIKDETNKLSVDTAHIQLTDDNKNDAVINPDVISVSNTDTNTSTSLDSKSIQVSSEDAATVVSATDIISPKFIKTEGTASQVLLADGSIATLNAANGIPRLDANGKIPLSQLGNLDTTLFQVVTALPTTGIKKNRIYLLKSSSTTTQNLYSEYVYTGDVSAAYDATKWEKLGEYKADIDLTPYSKKSETIRFLRSIPTTSKVDIQASVADGNVNTTTLAAATQSAAGVMTGADKKALDTLTARYPLSIASFTASPSLVEVGASADITFTWTLNNTDFHPITAQGIVVDGAASVAVDKSTKTYKKTGLAGATSATIKSATLTVNGSLTKSVNVTYHYPSYIGVVDDGISITETVLKGLTKSIEWGKGKSATLTTNNQIIIYAYPATYGDLTSIKDGNGFEGFAGYTKSTITFANKIGYNVYKQNIRATASSKYTFA